MCEKYVFAGIKRKSILFSIKSLVLLTALAAILVLLTAITVSATVYSPWTRVAVDTTSTTDIQCAKVGDANYTQEQEFTWGVLAINTHKSIYLPNEAAFIGIAVLDSEGRMVCDADVTLTITDPSNNETVLSTGNGLIKVSPQCCVYGVTNLPDYYTNYSVSGAGTYVMNLTVTAVTADGTKSITDVFSVQNSVDFDVARDGATRIYPSVPYVMNFTIKANKNYNGLIREYVPASFVITPQDGLTVTTVGDTKVLTWTRNLVEGETYNIYYEFDAPDVSPYLFTLGALEIGSWKEDRQWQIANDDIVTYYFDGYNVDEAWLIDPGYMVNNDLANYAECAINLGTEALISNTCPVTRSGTISKVEIQAFGRLKSKGDWVDLRPVFNTVDGNDYNAGLIIKANAPGAWGSVIDITGDGQAPSSGWTWSDVSTLDCDVECNHLKENQEAFCAKVWINVTHYTPTSWESYDNSEHTPPVCDDFSSYETQHTVYMSGSGFALSTDYRIIYWDQVDSTWYPRHTHDTSSDGYGNLISHRTFDPATDTAGTWYATVYNSWNYNPSTHSSSDSHLVIDDIFTVQDSAIPEFPGVVTAIAVCMLCAVAYMVMRRKEGKR